MAQYGQFNLPRASIGDIQPTHPTADVTASAFTAHVPQTTEPSGDGIFNVSPDGSIAHVGVILMPYADANDVEFSMRIWSWRKGSLFGKLYYVPQMLGEIDCIAGNIACGFAANRFLCDTLTLTLGDQTINPDSPANDTPGGVMAHLWGAHYVEVELAINGGTAADMNCLIRPHSS